MTEQIWRAKTTYFLSYFSVLNVDSRSIQVKLIPTDSTPLISTGANVPWIEIHYFHTHLSVYSTLSTWWHYKNLLGYSFFCHSLQKSLIWPLTGIPSNCGKLLISLASSQNTKLYNEKSPGSFSFMWWACTHFRCRNVISGCQIGSSNA